MNIIHVSVDAGQVLEIQLASGVELERLVSAYCATKKLEDAGSKARDLLFPWLSRRDEMKTADMLVVEQIGTTLGDLLKVASPQMLVAKECGCPMSTNCLNDWEQEITRWCRDASDPLAMAQAVALQGIEILLDRSAKQLKTFNATLRKYIAERKNVCKSLHHISVRLLIRVDLPTSTQPPTQSNRPKKHMKVGRKPHPQELVNFVIQEREKRRTWKEVAVAATKFRGGAEKLSEDAARKIYYRQKSAGKAA